jgi:hypothetical protein
MATGERTSPTALCSTSATAADCTTLSGSSTTCGAEERWRGQRQRGTGCGTGSPRLAAASSRARAFHSAGRLPPAETVLQVSHNT